MIDYFMQHMWQLWALISLICLIMELTMGDFFIMCFAIGGVCSAIASAIGINGVGRMTLLQFQVLVVSAHETLLLFFHRCKGTKKFRVESLGFRVICIKFRV